MERKVQLVRPTLPKAAQIKRVCAYARVSSGKDEMLHSLSAQVSYYQRFIQSRAAWKFCGVYADEAETGTKDSREQFQEMLAECRKGNIDLIITKSITRFARNTVTLLQAVRELRDMGIEIYFEEQNIFTLSTEGEVMLTILASYAQEESRSASENQLWRVKRNFEEGKVWGMQIYGYKAVDCQLQVIPEEAAVVKRIFAEFLSGKGRQSILHGLNSDGIKPRRSEKWQRTSIYNILRNYAYTGNLILQKTYREDFMTKKSIVNDGRKPKYHCQETHEAIISMETYLQAQAEIERRNARLPKKAPNLMQLFTSLIRCPYCGVNYRRCKGYSSWLWRCNTFVVHGKQACPESKQIREDTMVSVTEEVLGIKGLTYKNVHDAIDFIEAYEGNRLVFHLKNGEVVERVWKDRSRAESWTPEMKLKAKMKEAERQEELKRRAQ